MRRTQAEQARRRAEATATTAGTGTTGAGDKARTRRGARGAAASDAPATDATASGPDAGATDSKGRSTRGGPPGSTASSGSPMAQAFGRRGPDRGPSGARTPGPEGNGPSRPDDTGSDDSGGSSGGRRRRFQRDSLRLRNWRVPTRLAAILLIPVVLTLIFAGLRVEDQISRARQAGETERVARLAAAAAELTNALQVERDITAIHPEEKEEVGEVQAARNATDTAMVAFFEAAEQAPNHSSITDRVEDFRVRSQHLESLRENAYSPRLTVLATQLAYSDLFEPLASFSNELGGGTDSDVNSRGRAIYALSLAKASNSTQRTIIGFAMTRGTLTNAELIAAQAAATLENTAINEFIAGAELEDKDVFDQRMGEIDTRGATNLQQQALSRGVARGALAADPFDPEEWYEITGPEFNQLRVVERELLDSILEDAGQMQADAQREAVWNSAAVLLALIGAVLFAGLIARSMVGGMRVLRSSALDISRNRLPELVERLSQSDPERVDTTIKPIPLHGRDEIGEVARAFDGVHREAVRLAAEQSLLRNNVNAIFTNLSRRNQGLVERQLALITDLENNEADPEQLESLFRLDHLATRMRRNGENLLVLAGEEPGRRWTQPVPLLDVVRAAASEVEQYERVELVNVPETEVTGAAVNDLVHLLAELLENATTFSAPNTTVHVNGTPLPDGRMLIEIQDQGIGLPADEVEPINERLAKPPVIDVSVSRRMGLFVVGRLAARHGVRVQLRPASDGRGTTALVMIPASVVLREDRRGDEDFRASRPAPESQQGPAAATGQPAREAGQGGLPGGRQRAAGELPSRRRGATPGLPEPSAGPAAGANPQGPAAGQAGSRHAGGRPGQQDAASRANGQQGRPGADAPAAGLPHRERPAAQPLPRRDASDRPGTDGGPVEPRRPNEYETGLHPVAGLRGQEYSTGEHRADELGRREDPLGDAAGAGYPDPYRAEPYATGQYPTPGQSPTAGRSPLGYESDDRYPAGYDGGAGTGSYDTGSYPTGSYDTGAYATGGYETTQYDTGSYDTTAYRAEGAGDHRAERYAEEPYGATGYQEGRLPAEDGYPTGEYRAQEYDTGRRRTGGYPAEAAPAENPETGALPVVDPYATGAFPTLPAQADPAAEPLGPGAGRTAPAGYRDGYPAERAHPAEPGYGSGRDRRGDAVPHGLDPVPPVRPSAAKPAAFGTGPGDTAEIPLLPAGPTPAPAPREDRPLRPDTGRPSPTRPPARQERPETTARPSGPARGAEGAQRPSTAREEGPRSLPPVRPLERGAGEGDNRASGSLFEERSPYQTGSYFERGQRPEPAPPAGPAAGPLGGTVGGTGGAVSDPRSETAAGEWRSANDERWSRAGQVREPHAGGLTSSGLPRRVPRANLVPGAAKETPQAGPQVSRAPEDVRGRLTNLRRGIQQGRRAQGDTDSHGPENQER
ncbi:nitrate- and nitrite sensing domain-containing protein [Allostreptomyces psammosilenae]|uniref:histidine kinase n=1 Tax=Allostreptomyces psammosilenae TaxID=1892865 RepID=A0A853A7Q3_9ACTN|nr:nitrate- and nitrite sensing domain-containing protein [Allostreptomyces psammosilenae]NYI06568.1 signal transduction histidine kinase [Allostreptomyces psammosilenae]